MVNSKKLTVRLGKGGGWVGAAIGLGRAGEAGLPSQGGDPGTYYLGSTEDACGSEVSVLAPAHTGTSVGWGISGAHFRSRSTRL